MKKTTLLCALFGAISLNAMNIAPTNNDDEVFALYVRYNLNKEKSYKKLLQNRVSAEYDEQTNTLLDAISKADNQLDKIAEERQKDLNDARSWFESSISNLHFRYSDCSQEYDSVLPDSHWQELKLIWNNGSHQPPSYSFNKRFVKEQLKKKLFIEKILTPKKWEVVKKELHEKKQKHDIELLESKKAMRKSVERNYYDILTGK